MTFVRTAVVIGGLGLAAALAGALELAARAIRPRAPLPRYGPVPAFHLTDERGHPFDASAMAGHVSVVDFIFTRCESSCPRLTALMGELQSRLAREGSAAKLVSFSVDPENDTPPVLLDYAAHAHADAARWSFVTGSADDMTRAVVSGFKVAATKIAKGANDYDVMHGDWFVLVDAHAQLRGYYPTDEPGDLAKIDDDVRRLEHER